MEMKKGIDRRGADLPSNRITDEEREEFARLWEAATGEAPSCVLAESMHTDGEHDPGFMSPSPYQSILKDREEFAKIWEAVTGQKPNLILTDDDADDADLFKDTGVESAARNRDSQPEIKRVGTSG